MRNCLKSNENVLLYLVEEIEINRQSLPGHAAVNGKVEGVGEANDAVDEECDVPNKVVIEKIFINTAIIALYVNLLYLVKCTHECE